MKKLIHVVVVLILFTLTGCGAYQNYADQYLPPETIDIVTESTEQAPNMQPPTVVVNNRFFHLCSTLTMVDIIVEDDANITGTITSLVPPTESPFINNQTNWDVLLDAPYVILEDGTAAIFFGWDMPERSGDDIVFVYREGWFLFRHL